jgi:hypothetical protein
MAQKTKKIFALDYDSDDDKNSPQSNNNNNDDVDADVDNAEDFDQININDNKFDPVQFFGNIELCYYKMIDRFFKSCHPDKITKMLDIVNGKSEISLRVLDWFVTRYSKKKIDFDENYSGETFDVHISYKSQLKSYRKTYFDPFRRRKKFPYSYDKNDDTKIFNTTLGQLNFFYWVTSNNILPFVEKNIKTILKAMNSSNKEDKKKKDAKKKKKNSLKNKAVVIKDKDINIKATKTINEDEVQIILSFD